MIELFIACLLMAGIVGAAYSVAGGIDAVVKPDEPTHSAQSERAVGWSLVFGLLAIIVAVVLL